MNSPLYVDTSGLAKLILNETEGPPLRSFIRDSHLTMASSQLTEVELVRAVARADLALIPVARDLMDGMILLPISSSIRRAAGELFPGRTRSLDAIHIATALESKSDLVGFLTYENRMIELANESGIKVLSPK